MSSLRRGIRTVDQEVLDMYLLSVHRKVESLTRSFCVDSAAIPIPLAKQFQQYTDDVEAWLRKGLETVKYIIDARDTLTLIIGSGRLEEVHSAGYSMGTFADSTARSCSLSCLCCYLETSRSCDYVKPGTLVRKS